MTPPLPVLVDQLRAALEPHYDKERTMFGCRVFWVAGLMAAYVGEDRVVLRLPADIAAREVQARRGVYCAGGEVSSEPTQYVLYSAAASKRGDWQAQIGACVTFVQSLPPPKTKKSKRA